MTIVLQHQFWDLQVDEAARVMSVGLSFGGVPCTLRIPLAAITAFADPHVRYGLRFQRVAGPDPNPAPSRRPRRPTPAARRRARAPADASRRWSAWTPSAGARPPKEN